MHNKVQLAIAKQTPKCEIYRSPLERIQRAPLMKLIPASKHYRCPACETHFFRCLGIMQRC